MIQINICLPIYIGVTLLNSFLKVVQKRDTCVLITKLINIITNCSHDSFKKSSLTPRPVLPGPGMSTSTPMTAALMLEPRTPMSGISGISKLSDVQPLPQSSGSSS